MTTREDVNDFVWELIEAVDLEYEGEMYNLVEEGDWIASYKSEERNIIVMKASNGRYYRITQSRTGSHFTDWHYEEINGMVEVEPETISKIVWNEVK